MARFLQTDTFDAATELKDNGAVTTNNALATVGGVPRVVNLGTGIARMVLNVDLDSTKIVANDEAYQIVLEGSMDAAFTTPEVVTVVHAGKGSVNGEGVDRTTGRIQRFVMNTSNGSKALPFLRIKTKIVGTTPSISYRAFLTKSPM